MNDSLWKRLRFKFRVSVVNENTLGEVWHFRLSRGGVFLWLFMLSVLSFILFALIIWFTPLKNYLPGYNENIRQQLISETIRMDSIESSIELQNRYLDIIRNVVAGEIDTDSIQPLDSLSLQKKTELLQNSSVITDEFIAQYEDKERDNLILLDIQTSTPVYTLFRPVNGVVEKHYSSTDNEQYVAIRTAANASVSSVLTGTIVYVNRSIDYEWEIIVQHEGDYLSIYRNLKMVVKKAGEIVQAGETIAIVADNKPLIFCFWQKGMLINPEEVIVF